MPLPPFGEVAEFDKELAADALQAALFVVTDEALKPQPASRVPGPDGQAQGETMNERDTRLFRAGLYHLLEQGVLVFAPDAAESLHGWFPVSRVGTD